MGLETNSVTEQASILVLRPLNQEHLSYQTWNMEVLSNELNANMDIEKCYENIKGLDSRLF